MENAARIGAIAEDAAGGAEAALSLLSATSAARGLLLAFELVADRGQTMAPLPKAS
jgi:hypothetical protein